MRIFCYLLTAYWLILIIRIFSSWVPMPPSGVFRRVMDIVYDVTEPVLRLVRGLLPPLRMGGLGLDLSPILVFIVIGILQRALCG